MHADIVRHLSPELREELARLLFLAARHVDEDHVHARFKVLRVERERFVKLFLSDVIVLCVAEAFANEIGVAAAQGAVREREVGV